MSEQLASLAVLDTAKGAPFSFALFRVQNHELNDQCVRSGGESRRQDSQGTLKGCRHYCVTVPIQKPTTENVSPMNCPNLGSISFSSALIALPTHYLPTLGPAPCACSHLRQKKYVWQAASEYV